MGERTIEGFVIVSPYSGPVELMAYHTFGINATEAWTRHIGKMNYSDPNWRGELSRKIQHWNEKGYRLKKARMIIEV